MPAADDLIRDLLALEGAFATEVAPLSSELDIRAAQARFLGKKGRVSDLMKQLGTIPGPERPRVGEVANRVKGFVEAETQKRLGALVAAAKQKDLERLVDVSLPGRLRPQGRLHILTQVRRELVDIFRELGFEVADGPQVETDFYNFEALAMPADHPARDAQDTFYVSGPHPGIVLRTHTSSVQIRTMEARKPPIKIVAPGVVYRRDDDATHSPMFSQLELLVVEEGAKMSDLKGVILHFVRRFFGPDLVIRFRASYFPFVEPGVEVDMQCCFCGGSGCRLCKQTGWIELGGAGMVDPRVFAHCGIDAEKYTGYAFGFGIERMAMLRHGINDIKHYYEGDVRFLRQF
jgi:phenylalanyl-tRNA synthetase alpha chain